MPSRLRTPLLLLLVVSSLALGAVAATAEGGSTLGQRKQRIESNIDRLRGQIAEAKRKEGVLTTEIEAVSGKIRGLEGEIGVLSTKVRALERDLAASRDHLAALKELYAEQTRLLALLQEQHAVAQGRLAQRLVDLYETRDTDEVAILLQAGSISDVFEQVDYFNEIARQDRKIADDIVQLQGEMRLARVKTAATRVKVAAATEELAAKTAAQTAARDELVSQEQALASVRSDKQMLLERVRNTRDKDEEDLEAMLAASAAISARIQSAQSNAASQTQSPPPSGTSSSGFIYPVQGVLTSGFGMRWGRMHEGIDIAAPTGTPIHAAASGTVIYAGWMGGYGNIVIIDHGNGFATAYGHQSAIYVTSGYVDQGQVIGGVGSTGHSTGPHVHFEIRVNGVPVDPLNYL